MTLDDLRLKINHIDEAMLELFKERMAVSKKIGTLKKQAGLPVFDKKREDDVYERLEKKLNDAQLWPYYRDFMKEVMRLSKDIQK